MGAVKKQDLSVRMWNLHVCRCLKANRWGSEKADNFEVGPVLSRVRADDLQSQPTVFHDSMNKSFCNDSSSFKKDI